MFRMDNWKIVRANAEEWELYNLDNDRTEMFNLADSLPSKVHELEKDYYEAKNNLVNFKNEE